MIHQKWNLGITHHQEFPFQMFFVTILTIVYGGGRSRKEIMMKFPTIRHRDCHLVPSVHRICYMAAASELGRYLSPSILSYINDHLLYIPTHPTLCSIVHVYSLHFQLNFVRPAKPVDNQTVKGCS